MSTVVAPDEFRLFARVVQPERPMLSSEAARSILAMSFDSNDVQRINVLSERAREGTLSGAEQSELDTYERVGHLLGILHSKARVSLRATDSDK